MCWQESYDDLYLRAENLILKIPHALRNASMNIVVEGRLGWLPRKQCTNMKLQRLRRQIAEDACSLVHADTQRKSEIRLADLILNGVLRGQDTFRVLVSAMVTKAQKMREGRQRLTTATLPHEDAAALHEAAFALSCQSGLKGLLKFFGVSPACQPKLHLDIPTLPQFFCPQVAADLGPSELEKNLEKVISILGIQNREYVVMFDDTVVFPQYSLLTLRGARYCIGGTGADALIPTDTLDVSKMSKENLHQALVAQIIDKSHSVTRKHCTMLPQEGLLLSSCLFG